MTKLAIINRGVVGSGKSSLIAELRKGAPEKSIEVHCTDDLFMVGSEYRIDLSRLGELHKKNYENFVKSLEKSTEIVICDNTNIKGWEYKNYVSSAKASGYKVVAIVFLPDTIEKHIERNTHSVPEETILRMRDGLFNNLESRGVDKEYVISPEQGGKGSAYVKGIVNVLVDSARVVNSLKLRTSNWK